MSVDVSLFRCESHDSPEREEVADFLLRSLSRDVLDTDGSRHDVIGMSFELCG